MCKFYQFCNGKSGDGENGEKPERKIFTQCPPYTVFAKGIVIIMKDKTFSNRISGLTKKDIITIPNILSMFRLILIPLIFVFWFRDEYVFTFITVAVSAFTDVLDGFIARKFKMITDIGKFLDPLADKLTQLSVLICLTLKYRWIIAAVILLAVKELTMLAAGTRVLKKTDRMPYARWYGKAATAALDVSTATRNSLSRYSGIYCSHDIYSLRSFDNIFARTLSDALQNDDCRACRKKQRGF